MRDKASLLWGESNEMYTEKIVNLAEEAEKRLISDSKGFKYARKVYRKNTKRRDGPRQVTKHESSSWEF